MIKVFILVIATMKYQYQGIYASRAECEAAGDRYNTAYTCSVATYKV